MESRSRRRPARAARWGVFLDRDGTLFHLVPYLRDMAKARLHHRAGEALRLLREAGAQLVVVTNQSGVARGLMSRRDVAALHAHLKELLRREGVRLDAIEVCFHHPDFGGPCGCRKPEPGMILAAARRLSIDLSRSWTVGDNASDLEAGRAAGTKTGLVLTGYGRQTLATPAGANADLVAPSLLALARRIVAGHEAGAASSASGGRRR